MKASTKNPTKTDKTTNSSVIPFSSFYFWKFYYFLMYSASFLGSEAYIKI